MNTRLIIMASVAAGLSLGACDLMWDTSDLTPDYSVTVGNNGVGASIGFGYDDPWYDGFGTGGWNIGYLPPVGPPPVVGPLPTRPHPPGTPPRPIWGPSLPPARPPMRPGANRPILPDLNGSNPGPAIIPERPVPSRPPMPERPSGQRPGAFGGRE